MLKILALMASLYPQHELYRMRSEGMSKNKTEYWWLKIKHNLYLFVKVAAIAYIGYVDGKLVEYN